MQSSRVFPMIVQEAIWTHHCWNNASRTIKKQPINTKKISIVLIIFTVLLDFLRLLCIQTGRLKELSRAVMLLSIASSKQ